MHCSAEVNFCSLSADPFFPLPILANRDFVLNYLTFAKLFWALWSTKTASKFKPWLLWSTVFLKCMLLVFLLFRTTEDHMKLYLGDASHGALLIISQQATFLQEMSNCARFDFLIWKKKKRMKPADCLEYAVCLHCTTMIFVISIIWVSVRWKLAQSAKKRTPDLAEILWTWGSSKETVGCRVSAPIHATGLCFWPPSSTPLGSHLNGKALRIEITLQCSGTCTSAPTVCIRL